MASRWLYHNDGASHGPVSSKDLAALAKAGVVKQATLVKRADDLNWVEARKVKGLFSPLAPLPPPLPPARPPAFRAPSPPPFVASQRSTVPIDEASDEAPFPIWRVSAGLLATGVLLAVGVWFAFQSTAPNDTALPAVSETIKPEQQPAPVVADPVRPETKDVAIQPEDQDPVVVNEVSKSPRENVETAREVKKPDPQALASRVMQSVVTIKVVRADGLVIGSGFFVRDSHTLVTNYHVVEGGKQADAVLSNGKTLPVIGYTQLDPGSDLVLLSVQAQPDVTPLPLLGDSPRQGDEVWAFGSPEGLTSTVSRGIVSAIRRTNELPPELRADGKYSDTTVWVQTDAPISPGSSGGPLVNLQGEVIGISTFCRRIGQNLNFASSVVQIQDLTFAPDTPTRSIAGIPVIFTAVAQAAPATDNVAGGQEVQVRDQQLAAELEKNRESAERQQELNRLMERINHARSDLVTIEGQQTDLQRVRDKVAAQRDSIWDQGMKLRDQLDDLNDQIKRINKDINNRINALFGPRERDPALPSIRRSLASKISQRDRVIKQGDDLEAKYNDVDEQVKKLDSQLQEKTNRHTDCFAEIKSLEAKYKALAARN